MEEPRNEWCILQLQRGSRLESREEGPTRVSKGVVYSYYGFGYCGRVRWEMWVPYQIK